MERAKWEKKKKKLHINHNTRNGITVVVFTTHAWNASPSNRWSANDSCAIKRREKEKEDERRTKKKCTKQLWNGRIFNFDSFDWLHFRFQALQWILRLIWIRLWNLDWSTLMKTKSSYITCFYSVTINLPDVFLFFSRSHSIKIPIKSEQLILIGRLSA